MLTRRIKNYWVYILASHPRGTLYVGMTNDLLRRVYEHREGVTDGFTKQYGVKSLVYFEQHVTAVAAFQPREKHQTLVAQVEDRFDLFNESQLARPLA